MNWKQQPVRTTIIFGLISGVFFIPMVILLNFIVPWNMAFQMSIWTYLAIYGFLLTRWGNKRWFSIFFPLVILWIYILLGNTPTSFLIFCLGIFSWIRSGICIKLAPFKQIIIELLLCLGGGGLVGFFAPHSTTGCAIGIWLFALIQSLYFLFFKEFNQISEDTEIDPFDLAGNQAEKILAEKILAGE